MHQSVMPDKTNFAILAQALIVITLLWLTTIDVEQWWGEGDMWIAVSVPIMLMAGTVMCFTSGEKFRLGIADLIIAIWWAIMFIAVYAGHGIVAPSAFMKFNQSIMLFVALRILFSARRFNGKYLVWGIVAVSIYQSIMGCTQLIDGFSRHGNYPITGSFLNPGPYSAIIAMGLAGVMAYNKQNRIIYTISLLFAFILAVTWSRAAMVAVAVVAAIAYRHLWIRYWKWVVPVAAALLLLLYWAKQGSADGRMLMAIVSLFCIKEAPLLGSGIGGFSNAYSNGMKAFFESNAGSPLLSVADVTDNAFNELLTIGVEQGVVGMALFVAVIAIVIIRLNGANRQLKYMLLALLIFSLFSYPLHCLPYRILFVMICAWAAAMPSKRYVGMNRFASLAFSVVIIIFGVFMAVETGKRVSATKDYKLLSGINSRYVLDDYCELRPFMSDNPVFLFKFAKGLSEKRRYNDSNDMLRRGTMLSNDPMFYVCMGNNYKQMQLHGLAEECYQKAFSVMPNRLYPLYKQMMLYAETGDSAKAISMAHKVCLFKEKVVSSATKEMKREAEKIIEENHEKSK